MGPHGQKPQRFNHSAMCLKTSCLALFINPHIFVFFFFHNDSTSLLICTLVSEVRINKKDSEEINKKKLVHKFTSLKYPINLRTSRTYTPFMCFLL